MQTSKLSSTRKTEISINIFAAKYRKLWFARRIIYQERIIFPLRDSFRQVKEDLL